MGWKLTKYTGVRAFISSQRWKGKPDLIYYYDIRHAGKLVREKVGRQSEGYTAELANQLRAERIQELKHGTSQAVGVKKRKAVSIGEVWAKYEKVELPRIKGAAEDISRYNNHLKRRFANKTLDSIRVLDLKDLQARLHQGYSDQTVLHCLSLLRRLINKAIEWEMWTGINPVSKIKLPRPDNSRLRFLTLSEARMLLEEICCRSERTWRMCLLSLHTGMRFGEIAKIQWENLDLARGVVHVLDGKEGSRIVYLTPTARAMLERMTPGRMDELVFPNRKGGVSREISDSFERAVRALGLNAGVNDRRHRVVFHTLRHTYGSWLVQKGIPLYEIAKYMGHSDLEMTKRYSHLCPDQQEAAARIFEDVFNSADHW